jgi:hypothetical protein
MTSQTRTGCKQIILASNNATEFYGHENTHNPFLENLTFDDFRICLTKVYPSNPILIIKFV